MEYLHTASRSSLATSAPKTVSHILTRVLWVALAESRIGMRCCTRRSRSSIGHPLPVRRDVLVAGIVADAGVLAPRAVDDLAGVLAEGGHVHPPRLVDGPARIVAEGGPDDVHSLFASL